MSAALAGKVRCGFILAGAFCLGWIAAAALAQSPAEVPPGTFVEDEENLAPVVSPPSAWRRPTPASATTIPAANASGPMTGEPTPAPPPGEEETLAPIIEAVPAPVVDAPSRARGNAVLQFRNPAAVAAEEGLSDNAADASAEPLTPMAAEDVASAPLSPQPSAETAPTTLAERLDVKATAFKDVEPGATTAEELYAAWGEPDAARETGGAVTCLYRMEPFQKVEATIEKNLVALVVVYLKEPLPPVDVIRQLGLSSMQPAPVADAKGTLLGQVYPERGVLLSFAEGTETPTVAQIVVEPISAEPFVLRVLYDFGQNYERSLLDLEFALSLQPLDAQAHGLRAEVLLAAGRYSAALESATAAMQQAPQNVEYRLLAAQILLEQGEYRQAGPLIQAVLNDAAAPGHHKAKAHLLAGTLFAQGAERDFKAASQHHLAAIQAATPLATDPLFVVRRMAKQVLVEAHVALGVDVALGNWQRKEEVAQKWFDRAAMIAEAFIENDQGDPTLRLAIHRGRLAAMTGLADAPDPAAVTDAAIQEARRLLGTSKDALYQGRVEAELAAALADAVRIEHARGRHDYALRYAETATTLLDGLASVRERTAGQRYADSRLYFLVGAIHAIKHGDHQEAAAWYDRALLSMTGSLGAVPPAEQGAAGEWLVSMGVSFWETGEKERAVRTTEQGAELIKLAVEQGAMPPKALAVPFGNLAAMHKALGNPQQSERFAEMARKIESTSGGSLQR